MNKLNPAERETIILFNEGEPTAEIETHNTAMKKRLETLRREYAEISLVRRGAYSDVYIFPKRWIKIIPPRKPSDAQRAHLARLNAKKA